MYDGVTRTWRRNSEGNWEREILSGSALPAARSIQSNTAYASSTGESALSSSLIHESISGVHYSLFGEMNPADRYTDAEAPYSTYEVFRIFLGESPMFTYNTSTNATQTIDVSVDSGGSTTQLFISSGWNYEPSTNSISRSISESDTIMISELNSAINLVRNGGGKFKITAVGGESVPVSVRPSSGRKFLAEDVYINGAGNSLENYYNNSIAYQLNFGAIYINRHHPISYLSQFTGGVTRSSHNQYQEPQLSCIVRAPINSKIDRVFGTLSYPANSEANDGYNLVIFGADAQEERILGQIPITGDVESFCFIAGIDFDEKIIPESGIIAISLHNLAVVPGQDDDNISVVATILMKAV